MSLHDELSRLADTAPRPDIDHTIWDRGRSLRRRDRLVKSAIVLVMVVILGGLASIVLGPPRAVAPAGDTVPEGAIPSRIQDIPDGRILPLETDFAIGQASVAFFSLDGTAVVIDATDGLYHPLALPHTPSDRGPLALSPDGSQLAWRRFRSPQLIHVADLRSGEITDIKPQYGGQPVVTDLKWDPDSKELTWLGASVGGPVAGVVDVRSGVQRRAPRSGVARQGFESSRDGLIALPTTRLTDFVRFQEQGSCCLYRTLPKDLYPEGARVTPLGWADEHLLVAQAWAKAGTSVQGQHLVLFTSPDRPNSEWTYRILVRQLPERIPISVAVDLIPDLDGTSDQQLTHDFGEPDWPGDSPWRDRLPEILGGLLALLAGLAYIRMLRHQ